MTSGYFIGSKYLTFYSISNQLNKNIQLIQAVGVKLLAWSVWFFPFVSIWQKSDSFPSEIFWSNSDFCLFQTNPWYAVYTLHHLWHFFVPPSKTARKWWSRVLGMDSFSGRMPRATKGSHGGKNRPQYNFNTMKIFLWSLRFGKTHQSQVFESWAWKSDLMLF